MRAARATTVPASFAAVRQDFIGDRPRCPIITDGSILDIDGLTNDQIIFGGNSGTAGYGVSGMPLTIRCQADYPGGFGSRSAVARLNAEVGFTSQPVPTPGSAALGGLLLLGVVQPMVKVRQGATAACSREGLEWMAPPADRLT